LFLCAPLWGGFFALETRAAPFVLRVGGGFFPGRNLSPVESCGSPHGCEEGVCPFFPCCFCERLVFLPEVYKPLCIKGSSGGASCNLGSQFFPGPFLGFEDKGFSPSKLGRVFISPQGPHIFGHFHLGP